jgi:hypothetical protein
MIGRPRRQSDPSDAPQVMQHSASHVRHPFSIRSLRSLDALEESLTGLRRTNDQYSSRASARMVEELASLSKP